MRFTNDSALISPQFAKCGTDFECILGTFLLKVDVLAPFAILQGPPGGLGAKRLPKSLILGSHWAPSGLHLGSLCVQISHPFLMKKLGLFLHAFWLPKWSQMPPKIEPNLVENSICFRLHSQTAFHPTFGQLFGRFPKRPAFDLTAIYNVFVGLSLCPKIQKSSQHDQPK